MERLDWGFRVKEARRTPYSDGRVATLTDFFARPDGENSFARWLRMLMEDMLVVDAATVYPFFDMDGNVLTLEVMDGTLINRVIDDAGRSPPPPRPAFQQVIHGMPARNFTRDELTLPPCNASHSRRDYAAIALRWRHQNSSNAIGLL